jgi:hypothetical protein
MTKQGMSRQQANKEAAQIVKQEDAQAETTNLEDADSYFDRKRKEWENS